MSNRESARSAALAAVATGLVYLAVLGTGCAYCFSNAVDPGEAMERANRNGSREFVNTEPTTVMRPGSHWRVFTQFLFGGSDERVPKRPLPVVPAKDSLQGPVSEPLRFIWIGHSSVLLELGGRRVLIDPVFSERASLFSWIGPKRFQPSPLQARDLPAIDAVLISHDHYDHLDRETVRALAERTAAFHVPLGVGAVLKDWGVSSAKIIEYDWWDRHDAQGLTVAAVPARHFSGRGLFVRNRTLWCSWVIVAAAGRFYHSGDTGMTAQFSRIGERYGPFDLAFVKIAAYNENWPDIHLNPEQTIEAAGRLRAKALVPIHWGTFDLGVHSWHEPIERLVRAAEGKDVRFLSPKIGELVKPEEHVNSLWWREMMHGDQGK